MSNRAAFHKIRRDKKEADVLCSLIYTTAGKAQYFRNNFSISWILNAHQFSETSNSSFLYSFPTQKRLPDNLVYVRVPPPDVEPATNSVHRDRRSSKTSTGSNSKDSGLPNTGSVSEGIYDPNLINTIMLYTPIGRPNVLMKLITLVK